MGVRAFYYPLTKKVYVGDCADGAARDFFAAAGDEDAAYAS